MLGYVRYAGAHFSLISYIIPYLTSQFVSRRAYILEYKVMLGRRARQDLGGMEGEPIVRLRQTVVYFTAANRSRNEDPLSSPFED